MREKGQAAKQMEKVEKRMMAKQQANIKTDAPNAGSDIVEPSPAEEAAKSTA